MFVLFIVATTTSSPAQLRHDDVSARCGDFSRHAVRQAPVRGREGGRCVGAAVRTQDAGEGAWVGSLEVGLQGSPLGGAVGTVPALERPPS